MIHAAELARWKELAQQEADEGPYIARYDLLPSRLSLIDALEKAQEEAAINKIGWDAADKQRVRDITKLMEKLNSAHDLLRRVVQLTVCYLSPDDAAKLRAEVAKELGDAP